ncbi:MAG TPA: GTPase ObgE [Ktedonobacterales bacterium]|jgi:GTP-binding protein|nr:GTPase ObgE [Ktedonobacterales bacterium]
MQFYDRAKIYVQAGNGGDGSTHFRREKFVPMGGPDGGDGGRGGSIYLEADPGLNTLVDYHFRPHHTATAGGKGGGNQKHGAKGHDIILKVPSGTVVRSVETDELLGDLTETGQRVMVARGGRGGLGNTHFATSTNQAPREAQRGEPGEEFWLTLELKLIADIGLVGFPNAGKSTLISVVSASRPKIADYPFTTLVPNLGVVVVGDPSRGSGTSFVMADIPGLIEGAAQGVGLGHEFLRHVERTRLLLHLIDGNAVDREPWAEFEAINRELADYSADLATRPQVIVLTKMDLPEARERWPELRRRAEEAGIPARAISAATNEGVAELMGYTAQRLQEIQTERTERAAREIPAAGPVLRPEPGDAYTVQRTPQGFLVRGKRIERLVAMTNLENPEGVTRLEGHLRRLGVTTALERAGVQPGDSVTFGKVTLDWGEEM